MYKTLSLISTDHLLIHTTIPTHAPKPIALPYYEHRYQYRQLTAIPMIPAPQRDSNSSDQDWFRPDKSKLTTSEWKAAKSTIKQIYHAHTHKSVQHHLKLAQASTKEIHTLTEHLKTELEALQDKQQGQSIQRTARAHALLDTSYTNVRLGIEALMNRPKWPKHSQKPYQHQQRAAPEKRPKQQAKTNKCKPQGSVHS